MITKLYRKCFSDTFRIKIYNLFLGELLSFFRHCHPFTRIRGLFILLFSPFFPENEYYNAWRYIGKHGSSYYPFEKSVNYKKIQITVFRDKTENLPYVIHNGKRLYFQQTTLDRHIKKYYRGLLTEQDLNSPHRYLKSFDQLKGKTLLDCGAAEGIFGLDAIDFVEKLYLFECQEKWIAPLQATFKPWKDKVEIVKKYVGGIDEGEFTTIDSVLKNKNQDNIHIKMDIEGYELPALNGTKNLLTKGHFISLSVCTYHKENDAEEISSFFEQLGYSYEFTYGFLYIHPYLRKTVCRANNYSQI